MERFKIIKEVGEGTFGNVWQAINKETGEVVAIKKIKRKYFSWEECLNLQEVKTLRKINHPNIVKLKEVIRENNILFFVFEYMECNLYELMKDRKRHFSETEIRNWCFQIFHALAYIHQQGYFHRDLKPENLLCMKDVIKIADFGLAREISSQPPYTEYVSTRWYRAPEVLLRASLYGPPIDMWAMGAIMSELFTLCPLFPGSSEVDEIYTICSVIGSPNQISWSEGLRLADGLHFQFPQFAGVHLSLLVPSASASAISLISSLCSWDPFKRPTAVQALHHPFFQPCFYIPPSLRPRVAGMLRISPSVGTTGAVELKSGRTYPMGALSHVKPENTFASPYVNDPLKTGAQRKLERDYEELVSNEHIQYGLKQAPYIPPTLKYQGPGLVGRNSGRVWNDPDETNLKMAHLMKGGGCNDDKLVYGTRICGCVSDIADDLSQLTVSSGPQQLSRRRPLVLAGDTECPSTLPLPAYVLFP